MFRHPNYYKNLRKLARNRDSHVRPISGSADSATDQAISPTRATAPSRRATGPGQSLTRDSNADGGEGSSSKAQASSLKPQATSSLILEPRKSFKHPEPRCSTKIKLFLGCV